MAAGQGFKTFVTGEVLTAGDVNGYLMQGINVFTNATARDAAITAPAEGQFAFTKDNNSLWYYDGAAWVASGATGDIEGVTAGVGISGGGTSGTVTITNSMATEIAAKGDLIVGTGSQTFDNLTVGANNTVLTADSTTATGLKWAAASGGGKVLQVVSATNATSTSISSATFTDTSLSVSITPSSASSRIMVLVTQGWQSSRSDSGMDFAFRLNRDSTTVYAPHQTGNVITLGFSLSGVTAINAYYGIMPITYVDSPASTSALTYKTQASLRTTSNSGVLTIQPSGFTSSIIAIEIGA
jgi:hypothetical protein